MHLLASTSPHLRWFSSPALIFLAINSLPFSLSDPRVSKAGLFCDEREKSAHELVAYSSLFFSGMESLSQRVVADGWGIYAANSTNISMYGLAQCHGDLPRADCVQCYQASRTLCLPAARIFLDGCFLRYDRYAFFYESVDPLLDAVNCNSTVANSSLPEAEFRRNVAELVDRVTAGAAAADGRFAAKRRGGVYGLAQCWNSVGAEGCRAYLAKANREIRSCLPSSEGRALNAGCYLRYSTQNFFSDNTDGSSNHDSGIRMRDVIVAIPFSVVAFCMLCLFAGHAAYRRWERRKQERYNLGKISITYNKSSLHYKYETLEKATNYFDPLRKLGQGGAGSVFRGTLPDGKTVAVKRLFFSTRQWVDEFFNEVNLISGIEHKNVAKLLGFSIEGPESLLVYEYVPNHSLEVCLFDKNRAKILNWKERYNIIVGTAEGIAYLHGGSEFRIIHRDIKSGNVLLDENLDAKIADFGLARKFTASKTHLSTGLAGTFGYMAPEYIMNGQLTEKADVYSYGVLVLEIVCGRKNNAFVEDSGYLLQKVWKLYKTDRVTELVDPCLEGDFPPMEASRVLKIGLLCAQASVARRPSMVDVVRMLTEENFEIPVPKQPPFLNTSAL